MVLHCAISCLGVELTLKVHLMSSCEPPWQAHDDRNLARKLTAAEKKEKKTRKLVGAADEGEAPGVSVFRVRSLERPEHKFKVRVNAEVRY